MNRLEAIEKLRELTAMLVAAKDGPGVGDVITVNLSVHCSSDSQNARHWIDALGCDTPCGREGTRWYERSTSDRIHVFCPADYQHNAIPDLLDGCDVDLVPLEGGAN